MKNTSPEQKYISSEEKLCMACSRNNHFPVVTVCDNGATFQTVLCEECKAKLGNPDER